jgi:hypothetical protein
LANAGIFENTENKRGVWNMTEKELMIRIKPPKMWVSGIIRYLDEDGEIDKVSFFPDDLEPVPPKDWHLQLLCLEEARASLKAKINELSKGESIYNPVTKKSYPVTKQSSKYGKGKPIRGTWPSNKKKRRGKNDD